MLTTSPEWLNKRALIKPEQHTHTNSIQTYNTNHTQTYNTLPQATYFSVMEGRRQSLTQSGIRAPDLDDHVMMGDVIIAADP